MNIMGWRYDELARTLAGYVKTGAQLVCYDGKTVFPAGISDDIGLYYFVPKVARAFHCSLDSAIAIFFYGLLALACCIGVIGFCFYSRSWISRVIGSCGLLAFAWYAHHQITDIYLILPALLMAFVPWGLYFFQRNKADWVYALFLAIAGVVCGYAHFVRTYSSLPLLVFFVCGVLFLRGTRWRRVLVFCALVCGFLVPQAHMKLLKKERMQFVDPMYKKYKEEHVFWHNVYTGFGFLHNTHGIEWNDDVAVEHARRIDPTIIYPSAHYDSVVRGMVINLFVHQHDFFMQTLFAKFGVILYYLLLFANIGLLLALLYRKPWKIEVMLWLTLLTSSIFGMIALPGRYYHYTLGMHTMAFLYCLISIEYAVRQGIVRDLWRWCTRLLSRAGASS